MMEKKLLTEPLPAREPPREGVTAEEFCELVGEDQKANLIGGVIYMDSPASFTHEQLFGFLYVLLRTFVNRRQLGFVLGSRTAVRLSDYDAPEPDILFVAADRAEIIHENFIAGAPDLAVEIVSPSSRDLDLGPKRDLYRKAGVREYWLVDPYRQRIQFLANRRNRWRALPVGKKNVLRSEVLPGFWLRTDWLFTDPLPDVLEAATTILEISNPT